MKKIHKLIASDNGNFLLLCGRTYISWSRKRPTSSSSMKDVSCRMCLNRIVE